MQYFISTRALGINLLLLLFLTDNCQKGQLQDELNFT